ncbi:ribonuclease Z [Antarcticibacterium flavum]|uniref:Ribonuclease Z n=1 Tax=Antarcticibacterium flavum TaxID=2058175 RepID=A0A5B7WYM7_9FLAO|nr:MULTISPECIES: ribonuclease Z [Antarcticibacterium]MCM4161212.1 ribonuclease Z [Antarcticibacterium sp. W02-3]QCY68286.1 ribonuclease Z [Antarcticibacterium flavum]
MKITEKDKYKILEDEKGDLTGFATYISQNHKKFKNDNVIINLLQKEPVQLENLLSFLEISNLHRSNKKSFVIVSREIDIDSIPEELIVVPTLVEAEDIINMEELERELGF